MKTINFKVDFSARGHNYLAADIKAVEEAMKYADPLTQGKYLKKFEEEFSNFNGSKNCFAVSSCTAALDMSATLCFLELGDEVIIPSHTFCATAIPFAKQGAKIAWADIDPETRVISAEMIKLLITKRTKVIVVVHLYGLMADMSEIMDLAREHSLLVVEDCAQSLGADINGKKAGNYGNFACFSFHTHKNITTLGEGGMLVVKDDNLAEAVPGMRHNGIRGYDHERERYWVPAMGNVDFDIDNIWPYNYCIGEVQCAVGVEVVKRLEQMNLERNLRARKVINALSDYPEISFQKVPEGFFHSYHLLSARYDGSTYGKSNDDFIDLMAFTYKIKVIVQYYPLYRYPMFIKAGFGKAHCPNTDYFYDNMVSFPFHHGLSDDDINYIIDSTIKTLDQLRDKKN